MASPQDILNMFANTDTLRQKMTEVAAASDAKRIEIAGRPADQRGLNYQQANTAAIGEANGIGQVSATPVEQDLLGGSSPIESMANYGPAALGNLAAARNRQGLNAISSPVDPLVSAKDYAITAANSAAQVPLQAGAFVSSFVDPATGARLSKNANDLGNWAESFQSPELQTRRADAAVRSDLRQRDQDAYYKADKEAGMSDTMAGLRDLGRGVVDGATGLFDDPSLLAHDVVGGAASFAVMGGAGLKAAGMVGKLAEAGGATVKTAEMLARASMGLPIGLGEGGGAFQQTAAAIDAMPKEDLLKLPEFASLYQDKLKTYPDADTAFAAAKDQYAGERGRTVGSVVAPAALVLSRASGAIEHPFSLAPTVKKQLASTAGEMLEEGGIAAVTDPLVNKETGERLTRGVGSDVAANAALGGLSANVSQAGTMKTVHAVANGIAKVAGKTTSAVIDNLASRGEAKLDAAAVPATVVAQAANEVRANAEATAPQTEAAIQASGMTPEEKARATEYAQNVQEILTTDISSMPTDGLPASVASAVADSTNLHDAMVRIANVVNNSTDDNEIAGAMAVHSYLAGALDQTLDSPDAELFMQLPANDPTLKQIQNARAVLASVSTSGPLRKAMQNFDALIERTNGGATLPAITAENASTPEARQTAQAVVAMADRDPSKVDPVKIDQILQHSDAGLLQLTPIQRASLTVAKDMINSYTEANSVGLDAADQSATVGAQVISNVVPEVPHMKSANAYRIDVMQAMRAGNVAQAQDNLNELGQFAQLMQNKMNALMTGLQTGQKQAYQSLNDKGQWFDSSKMKGIKQPLLGVTPTNESSVKFAQKIAAEAQIVTDLHDSLLKAFPQLKAEGTINRVQLDPVLKGNPAVVAAEFRTNVRSIQQPIQETANGLQNQGRQETAEEVKPIQVAQENTAAPAQVEQQPASQTQVEEAKVVPDETKQSTEKVSAAVEQTKEPATSTEVTPSDNPVEQIASRLHANVRDTLTKAFKATRTESPVPLLDPERKESVRSVVAARVQERVRTTQGNGAAVMKNIFKAVKPSAVSAIVDKVANGKPSDAQLADAATISALHARMDQRLQAQLAKKRGTGTNASALMESGALAQFSDQRMFNLVTEQDGKFSYEPDLMDSALLAGFHHLLNFTHASNRDDAEIQARYGITPSTEVLAGDIADLSVAPNQEDMVRNIARDIPKFWGMSAKSSDYIGITQGLPLSLAAEMVQSMKDLGLLDQTTVRLQDGDKVTEHVLVQPADAIFSQMDSENPSLYAGIGAARTAIAEAVIKESGTDYHVGEAIPATPEQHMHEQNFPLTAKDKEAIAHQNSIPNYVDVDMADFYANLGEEGLITLFSEHTNDGAYNEKHRLSIESRNGQLVNAYRALTQMIEQIKDAGDLDTTPIRFAHNMSSVNRMQQLAAFGPQANKLVREAILPTWSTIDMSSVTAQNSYLLAQAQALGIKINKQNLEQNRQAVAKKIEQFSGVIEALRASKTGELDAVALRKAFADAGEKAPTPLLVHALMDYVRLTEATAEEKKAYRTSLYVEADGMTNGPIMAMLLFQSGHFTADQLQALERGAIVVGERTAAFNLSDESKVDLYNKVSQNAKPFLQDSLQSLNRIDPTYVDSILTVFSTLLKGKAEINISAKSFDEKVKLLRDLAKNPLTVTTYGGGVGGIANNVSGIMADKLYALMTQALQAKKDDPSLSVAQAYFGRTEDAEAQWKDFKFSMDYLQKNVAKAKRTNAGMEFQLEHRGASLNLGQVDPSTFTLSTEQFDNLNESVRTVLVEPMYAGIQTTLGESTMNGLALVRDATNVMSVVTKAAHDQFLQEILAKKEATKEQTGWKTSDFVTGKEYTDLQKAVQTRVPLIQTQYQNFMPAKSVMENDPRFVISGAFGSSIKLGPDVMKPAVLGVGGIPRMNQGMGDGRIMQGIGSNKAIDRTVLIFDGAHIPLDKIEDWNVMMNQSVLDAAKENPFTAIHAAFAEMQKHVGEFAQAIEGDKASKAVLDRLAATYGEGLEAIVAGLATRLSQAQEGVNARRAAMEQSPWSSDQMAASGSAAINQEDMAAFSDWEGLTLEEKAAKLNELAQASVTEPSEVRKVSAKELSATLGDDAFLQALNKIGMKDYSVHVVPDLATLRAWGKNMDLSGVTADTQGLINPNTKQIVMVGKISKETLAHEMIHAATYDAVSAHYAGEKVSNAVKVAVQNIEKIATKFLGETDMELLPNQLLNAASVIGSTEATASARAEALNEFMAWSLSNDFLKQELKESTSYGAKLKKLASSVWKQMVNMVLGEGNRWANTNMLKDMQINTAVIAAEQASMAKMFSDATLQHNGSSTFTELRDRLADKYLAHLERYSPAEADAFKMYNVPPDAMKQAIETQTRMEAVFGSMTQGEATTYRMISAVLQAGVRLDSSAKAELLRVYQTVMKNLTPEQLKPTVSLGSLAKDMALAQARYNALNTSQGIASFAALAMTSTEFQKILATMQIDGKIQPENKTIDAKLSAWGNNMMDSLAGKLSGRGKSTDVDTVINNLMTQLGQHAADEMNHLDRISNVIQDKANGANDFIKDMMSRLGAKGDSIATGLRQSNGKIARGTGAVLSTLSRSLTDEGAESIAYGLQRVINKGGSKNMLRSLVRDMMGRTTENASIVDLVKKVRATSQQLRQITRNQLPATLNSKFTRTVSQEEWTALHSSLARTDVASLLDSMSWNEALDLLGSKKERDTQIAALEAELGTIAADKSKQLATYMTTGKPGHRLLRNAFAIANLSGMKRTDTSREQIDKLVTLYALNMTDEDVLQTAHELFQDEPEGMEYLINFMHGIRVDEMQFMHDNEDTTLYNHYKGYSYPLTEDGRSIIVRSDDQKADLEMRGYVRLQDYQGTIPGMSTTAPMGYYYAPIASRAAFEQGILQNVNHTTMGVDASNGVSTYGSAGRITNPKLVERITKALKAGHTSQDEVENLMPVYDGMGVVVAYERSMDPAMLDQLNPVTDLSRTLAARQGRMIEEAISNASNKECIDTLKSMFDEQTRVHPERESEYFDLLGDASQFSAVQKDAIKLIPDNVMAYASEQMDGHFWVRKDLMDDVAGRRMASVGDFLTGMNDLKEADEKRLQHALVGLFGRGAGNAYNRLVKGERFVQAAVMTIKTNIVVRSIVVPVANMVSNARQLQSRGVPMMQIARGLPNKLNEVHQYAKNQVERAELMADRHAYMNDPVKSKEVQRKLDLLDQYDKGLSIWPLIEAGEFSTVNDVGITADDVEVTSGRFDEWIEKKIQQLPKGMRTAAAYGYLSRNTALFRGLQKSVQYGDFVAKAVLFDHYTDKMGMTDKEALGHISDEFVNYDRLPSRGRGYLESIGMLWFYNYKLRTLKVAMSTIRDNPFHTLMATVMPHPSSAGTPLTDNIVGIGMRGSLGYSMGPGMATQGVVMNPWFNLL